YQPSVKSSKLPNPYRNLSPSVILSTLAFVCQFCDWLLQT
ncbi:unnamed protein product, partial [Allacma fusca]